MLDAVTRTETFTKRVVLSVLFAVAGGGPADAVQRAEGAVIGYMAMDGRAATSAWQRLKWSE